MALRKPIVKQGGLLEQYASGDSLDLTGTNTFITLEEHSSAPGTPSANNVALYAKADGFLYSKDDAGVETQLGGGGGSGTVTSVAVTGSTGLAVGGSPITTSGTITLTLDNTLQVLSTYNTNGLLTQTAADTFTGRTITGTTNQISVTNGDGVSGNPTIAISSNPVFPGTTHAVMPTGTTVQETGTTNGAIRYDTDTTTMRMRTNGAWKDVGTVTSVAATQPAAGLTISGSPITSSGTLTFALANDLAAVEGLSTNGIATRTATDTWTTRTITGTANRVTVTNGDGVSGNPTIDIAATYVGQTSITTLGTITTGTWNGSTITVPNGGTGLTTVAQGDLLYGSASNTLSALTKDTNATRYLSNTGTSNNPAWAQVNLTNGVTGTLPIGSGGTGQTTQTAAFDALAPTTTTGDLIYRNASNNVRLAIGSTNDVLTVIGGVPVWQAPAGTSQPANQIVYGTGTGVSSSSGFTFNATSGALTMTNSVTSPGASSLTAATSSTAATAGAAFTISGGTGNTTGAGGAVSITGGQGGATGVGGNLTLQGGSGGGTSGAGGSVTLQGGLPTNGNGGSVTITGRNGVGSSRNGGGITISSGATSAGGGATAGAISITAGAAVGSGDTPAPITITAGSHGAGTGGALTLAAGAATAGSNAGGAASFTGGAGSGAGTGGAVTITGGAGGSSAGTGGSVTITGGSTANGGTYGAVTLAGATGAGDGNGGAATVQGGNGSGTNRNGGNVTISGGTATGTGTNGTITFNTSGTQRLLINGAGNVVVGTAALATNATDGFLYIPTTPGVPTGVPTTFTGRSALTVDTTNDRLYGYDPVNNTWLNLSGTATPGGANTQLQYNNSGAFGGASGLTTDGTNLTIAGNLTFSGTTRRITADFSNATASNRTIFQSSTTNGNTFISTIPNGTALLSGFVARNAADADNAGSVAIRINGTQAEIATGVTGTGSVPPLVLLNNATEVLRITTANSVVVGTAALTTTATDGFLYIPTTPGVPTGVPTTFTGRSALTVDTTNNRLYGYDPVDAVWLNLSGSGGLTISDDTTTNATRYVTFTSATSGSISTANVASTKLTFNPSTGTLSATSFNSLSDERIKTDIKIVTDGVDTVKKLNGVQFTWKETGKKSYGVIAQQIEQILPDLVDTLPDGLKTVNYSGIIGFLIEAVKELSARVEQLENK